MSRKVDLVYEERNRVVALVAALAVQAGYPVWLGKVNDATEGWTFAIYIEFPLPTGQVSWHLPDTLLPLVDWLPRQADGWDRTPGQGSKYARLEAFIQRLARERAGQGVSDA